MTLYVSIAPPASPFQAKTKSKALVLADLAIFAQAPSPPPAQSNTDLL